MNVAFFLGSFPVISETFILRQIVGLIELNHNVDIYVERRPEGETPVHPEVLQYNLLEKTTYISDYIPAASGFWEMPVWPVNEQTWLPGFDQPIQNLDRLREAAPHLSRCLTEIPELTFEVLDTSEYGFMAESLSAFYRLAILSKLSKAYDVLHAHFGPVGNLFRFAKKLWNAPLVVSFHGYDFSSFPREHGRNIYKKLFEDADAVTVNSEYTRREVQKLGCSPQKIHKISVGLSPKEFSFHERKVKPGEQIRILTVARLVEIKGHEYVIRAISKVLLTHHEVQYDIVGEGPLRAKLEELIHELGVGHAVTIHGAKKSDDVQKMMDEAHFFVLCSVNIDGDMEGQGLVLQEAQASGLPVLATNHGAFPEGILPGISGLLVAERDVDSLAETLIYLVEHSELWPEMGRKGRKFVEENYDILDLNNQIVKLYKSLDTKKRGASL